MPNNTNTSNIAEAVAEALADGRHGVQGAVVTAAHRRQDEGQAPVALRQNLDPRAGREGRAAHLLAAITEAGLLDPAFAPRTIVDHTTGDPVQVLTDSQLRVLTAAAQGYSYTGTADHLHMSVSTVKGHVAGYYKRLGVSSVPEAVIAAIRVGVLPVSVLTGTDAPTTTRRPRVQCSHEGCRKTTNHASGLCPDHR